MCSMRVYVAYVVIAFKRNTVYRFEWITGIINTCLQIFISFAIWKALYGSNQEVNGVTLGMIATNFVIGLGLTQVFTFDETYVQHKINSGLIGLELLKPINFHSVLMAETLGNVIFKVLTNYLPALVLSIIFLDILPAAGVTEFILFFISICIGFGVLWSISLTVQMLAFWIINVWSIATLKNAIVMVLSGALIPVWFMPSAMQSLLNYTPFKSIYFTPIQIYLGNTGVYETLTNILIQVVWLLIIYSFSLILWQFGKKKIIVQGG